MTPSRDGVSAKLDHLREDIAEVKRLVQKHADRHAEVDLETEQRLTRLESQLSMRSWAGSVLLALGTALGVFAKPQSQ